MNHLELIRAIQGFYAIRTGQVPSESELMKAAVVALAERVLSDHPEGGAHRIRHPRANEVEEARARVQETVRAYRQSWRPKVKVIQLS